MEGNAMHNRLDRRVPGSLDEVVRQLLEVLDRHGLTVTQPDTGDTTDVRILQVTDPAGIATATDVDPDAATTITASISLRRIDQGVQIALIEPVATATLTEEAALLEPAQQLQDAIITALDALTPAQGEQQDGQDGDEGKGEQVGDARVRRVLLDGIHQTASSLGDLDVRARADTLFVLAKAYTAMVSLERTDEVELHLA
jgi:hypothetical protein